MGRAVGVRSRELLAGSYLGPQKQELGPDTLQVGLASLTHTPVWDIVFCFCFQGQFGLSENQSVGPWCWYVANNRLEVERAQAREEDPRPGPRV